MQVTRVECALGALPVVLETGKLAKQAHGAVMASLGETMALVTAVEGTARAGTDFFPLQVEYRERLAPPASSPAASSSAKAGRPSRRR